MARRSALIPDQRTEMMAGLALTVAGAYLLWEAYEGRGKRRPFGLRLFGGWV
jgi:hypothetical protein